MPNDLVDIEKYHWPAIISFNAKRFSNDGYCRRHYFDDVLAAVWRGHVHYIFVDIQTALWTKDRSTWHVAPPNNREYRNTISSLTWEEKFGLQRLKETDDEPKPQLVELPARVYSTLSALLAIAAALLVLTFLRQH